MLNHLQKSLLILSFQAISLVAMEDIQVTIPKKSIFIPTANTAQANAKLLHIINKIKFQKLDWENIKKCLENDADPNTINYKNETLLIIAIKSRNNNFVQSLIKYKADVNQKNDTYTPLGLAIQCKNIEIIKQLFQAKAAPINIDNNDNTVFHLVVDNNLTEFIETLITHINFEVKNPQQSPLELVNEHIQYIKHILQIKNKENKTALELLPKESSIGRGYMYYIERLLDGTLLQKDLDTLTEKYSNLPSILGDNLALEILKNHYNSQEQTQNNV